MIKKKSLRRGAQVANTDDGACAMLHNGSATAAGARRRGGVVTYLLYQHVPPPPTFAPTTFFCDFDGSGGAFALSLCALACGVGVALLALLARVGRCEEAKASFDLEYNLWLGGQRKPDCELTEIERVKKMEFEVTTAAACAPQKGCELHSALRRGHSTRSCFSALPNCARFHGARVPFLPRLQSLFAPLSTPPPRCMRLAA
jgi:hypothetical protein